MHEGGTRCLQPKFVLVKTEAKGRVGWGWTHWYSSAKVETAVNSAESRGGVGVATMGRVRERTGKQIQRGPCVNPAALPLKIMNTKIICNLSGPLHTRSAPLARQNVLAVGDSDTFWF